MIPIDRERAIRLFRMGVLYDLPRQIQFEMVQMGRTNHGMERLGVRCVQDREREGKQHHACRAVG